MRASIKSRDPEIFANLVSKDAVDWEKKVMKRRERDWYAQSRISAGGGWIDPPPVKIGLKLCTIPD